MIMKAVSGAAMMALGLAGCASERTITEQSPPAAAAPAPEPTNLRADEITGRYGLASYHREQDRARTETQARAQCNQPYNIGRGPSGGVLMHLADAPEQEELRLKAGPAKNYIGPSGPAGAPKDREIVSFNGRVLVLRWLDPEIAGRYGTMVFVRCGARA